MKPTLIASLTSGVAALVLALVPSGGLSPEQSLEVAGRLYLDGETVQVDRNRSSLYAALGFGVVSLGLLGYECMRSDGSGSSDGSPILLATQVPGVMAVPSAGRPQQAQGDGGNGGDDGAAAATSQSDFEQRKRKLWAMLQHACPQLLGILEATPLRLIGEPRSGKTTLAKTLALLRMLFLDAPAEAWSPDDESQEEIDWPPSFEVYGRKEGRSDYPGIELRIASFLELIECGDRSPRSYVLDEFGSYSLGIDGSTIARLVKVSLMRAAKHGKYLSIVLHGKTRAFYGDVPGISEVFAGYPTIEFIPHRDERGRACPANEIYVTNAGGGEGEIMLPVWLNPEQILLWFPELSSITSPLTDSSPQAHNGEHHHESQGVDSREEGSTGSGLGSPKSTDQSQAESVVGLGSPPIEWTWESVHELLGIASQEQIYRLVRDSVDSGLTPAQVVKTSLGFRYGNDRPNRSYATGKDLLQWLCWQFRDADLIARFQDFFN